MRVRARASRLVTVGALAAAGLALVAWAAIPAARAVLLVQCPHRSALLDGDPFGMPVVPVRFTASDGVPLSGWYVGDPSARGTVILVHGSKSSRVEMIDRAAFVHAAHYAVLLYDSRGCGESGGTFGVGATEDRDVVGAATYVRGRGDPGSERIAVLGLSLGAGDALIAAGEDSSIAAVIADSTWGDERTQIERMISVAAGPVSVPLLPYEPAVVDLLIGGRIEDARPRDALGRIAPRPVQLIHCQEDDNATTPLAGAQAMFDAGHGGGVALHVFAGCGHAGAYPAHPADYERVVLDLLGSVDRARSAAVDLR